MKEIWRPVKRFEGKYEVSNFGRIKSVKRTVTIINGRIPKRTVPERIMRCFSYFGYKNIVLRIKGKAKSFRVHRLVAEAFIPNPDDKPYVNHIDNIRHNNHVSNLEWCTPQENIDHAVKIGVIRCGEDSATAILTEKQVIEIKKSNLSYPEIAAIYGMDRSTIGKIKTGKIWAHITVCVLFMINISSFSQTIIPNSILDTMIFEVKRGRQCEFVMQAQSIELEKQGLQLVHTNTALKLSQSSNQTLTDLLNNSRESQQILGMQFQKDLSEQKRKTKRWRKMAVIQTLGIVVLIILTL